MPPSTRAIYAFSRQQIHDVRADAKELGLAGAGIDEVGLTLATGDLFYGAGDQSGAGGVALGQSEDRGRASLAVETAGARHGATSAKR